MADRKISELTNITGANLADDDEFALVDTSADETKAITFGEFKTALDTATGFVRITGDTMTGNLSMGDNVKAIFGAGSDLSIYHDGSNSYVSEVGTGDLRLGAANIRIGDNISGASYIYATQNAEVTLYHNNSPKLATTSTGVDITGTLTSDGLTVDGAATITVTDNSDTLTLVSTDADATVGPVLNLFRNSASPADNDVLGRIVFKGEDSAGNDATFARIEAIATDVTNGSEDGRIDFFAAKDDSFSAALSITGQNVGIGASPSTRLTVGAGVSSEEIRVDAGAGWADLTLNSNATNGGHIYFNDGSNAGEIFYYHVSDYMAFNTAGSEAMRLDSSGRVGIGVSPSSTLDISAAANTTPLEITAATDGYNYSTIRNAAGNDVGYFGLGSALVPSGSADDFVLRAQRNALVFMSGGNSERMRLNSSGHLLIGKTADDNTTAGTVIHDNGFMSIARSSNIAMILDRHDTDGEILRFTKSGTSVGSIGCNNNDPFIARAGGNGFRWYSGAVVPTNDSGATADNVMDLGSSVGRFKDLYLSGGVFLGGTGSANKLDDYEEGTWIPSLTFGGTNTGLTYHTDGGTQGHYTKIGNQVIAHFSVNLQNKGSSTGNVNITGLPFNPANTYYNEQGGFVTYFASLSNIVGTISVYVSNGPNVLLRHMDSATAGTNNTTTLTQSNFNSGSRVWGTVIYKTNA